MVERRPRPRWLAVTLLALVLAGPGGLIGPVSTRAFSPNPWPWLELLGNLIQPLAGTIHNVTPGAIDRGTDGRLTVLLVGSDWRPRLAGTGERTDAMMVVTVDDQKQISAVSLPRDVGNVPIGPNEAWKAKVNGLFKHFKQTYGTRELALEHMRTSFAYTFGIEIDYVAYIRFTGVDRLVDEVGGVPVAVPYDIYDPTIVDDRSDRQHGAKFLASDSTLMRGNSAPLCYTVGVPVNWDRTPSCNRALLYVRSRHGPGNNDWRRARRQQGFLFATIGRVVARGSAGNLQALRGAALSNADDFYTTLPTDPASVVALFDMLDGAQLVNQAVLMPSAYAFNVPGSSKQELHIDTVRSLMHEWFAPLQ
jgi:anionic cell wall polymer biosynthesis LytR-Cps2A-Psr (LCP) family protein